MSLYLVGLVRASQIFMNYAIEINLCISICTQTAAIMLNLERKITQLQKEIQHARACAMCIDSFYIWKNTFDIEQNCEL